MKKITITTLFFAALATVFAAQPASAQVSVNISIGGFYDELEPYGRWVDCRYGECWVPARVSRHWQPYGHGSFGQAKVSGRAALGAAPGGRRR